MRNRWLWVVAVVLLSACEIEEGSFDGSLFDGDLFEDSSTSEQDGGADDEDAGKPPKDGGKPDAGKDSGTMMMDADGPPEPPLTPSDFAAVVARGQCAALTECMGARLVLDQTQGNDCVDFVTRRLADQHLHWLPSSVSASRVIFRPERLEQCEKDIAALKCDVRNRRLPASCEQAIEGKVMVDGSCAIDQDCAGNAWCDKGQLESCPGTCAQPQGDGMPCSGGRESAQCADGLVCRSGMCQPPLSEGDDCDDNAGLRCPPGLVCASSMCQSVESLYVRELGASCNATGPFCKMGLVCQGNDANSTAGTCVQPAQRNGACKRSVPAVCPVDQYCKNKSSGVTTRAAPGMEGICADRPKDGDVCVPSEECTPGAICIEETNTCKNLKTAGGVCATDSNAECYAGSCEGGICAVTTIKCDL